MLRLIKVLIVTIIITGIINFQYVLVSDILIQSTLRPMSVKNSNITNTQPGLFRILKEHGESSPEAVASLESNSNLRIYLSNTYQVKSIELKKDLFPDGEMRIIATNPKEIEGRLIWLVHNINTDDDFVELILQIAVLMDAGAREIVCLLPQSILKSSILLDAISPMVKIYTLRDSLFQDQRAGLISEELILYQPVSTKADFEKKRKFEYVLFTEETTLKNQVISGLTKFSEDDNLKTGTIKVNTFGSREGVDAEVPADVKGKDCLLIHSTHAHKNIVELLAILERLKKQGAKDIHILLFFSAYDRQEKNFPASEYGPDALSANAAKMFLTLISKYCGRIYTINTHYIKEPRINVYRFQGIDNLEIVNLNALPYLMRYFRQKENLKDAVIIAPDEGVADFLNLLSKVWQQELHVFKKQRSGVYDVSFDGPEGINIAGRDIIILDDVISSGSTILKLASELRDKYNAGNIFVGIVHGKQTEEVLNRSLEATDRDGKPLIQDIVSTDTISSKISKVSVADLIVEFLRENQIKANILTAEEAGIPSIALILPYRLAGAGDIVFIVNTAQKLKQLYPDMPIKVIFLNYDDYLFLDSIKLLSDFNSEKNIQRLYGITYINAMDSMENVNRFVGKNDLAIIYAIYQSEYKEETISYFERFAPSSAKIIKIHELGRELPWRDSRETGNYTLGFSEYSLGIPPTAPNFESYVKNYKEKDAQDIEKERNNVLRKIPGYDILDIDKIVRSEWGFIYAHEPYSLEKYFESFIKARQDYRDFADKAVTIFVTYGETDEHLYNKAIEIGKKNGFNIFEYSYKYSGLRTIQDSESNVTLIMDTGIPRKLFGQLFVLSDDLPSLITGQDNLSNIIYVNALMQGRVFFWEVLLFQYLAEIELKIAAEKILRPETYQIFEQTMKANQESDYGLLAMLFAKHQDYRGLYKELAESLIVEFDFAARISHLITEQWPDAIRKQRPPLSSREEKSSSSGMINHKKIYLSIYNSA